jgi:adenosylcobinamide kinase/adenosylcobinamide-phosphate guanylyltransferase
MMNSGVTVYTGGARSGKSRLALSHALRYPRRAFIATAMAFDDEMRQRIAIHQVERGERFLTLEEPIDLAGVIRRVPPATDVVLIDCLTVWLGNLMHHHGDDHGWYAEIDELLVVLRNPPLNIVLVTNEVGMGIVPEHAMGRRFRDIQGFVNQKVAEVADVVVFVACGLPLALKGTLLP